MDSVLYTLFSKMDSINEAVALQNIQDSQATPNPALQKTYNAMLWLRNIFSYFSAAGAGGLS